MCSEQVRTWKFAVFGQLLILCLGLLSCGYHFWVGDLTPVDGEEQSPGITVSDDGTVTFVKERLELAVRPLTVEELNRQLPGRSVGGIESTNPYTYGDWKDPKTGQIPERFTVFLLKVKNYSYPKVQVDPMMVSLTTDVGMTYLPLGKLDLETYYRPYVTGYAGVPFLRLRDRVAATRSTLFTADVVFSGQEKEGFLVFPKLHHKVKTVQLTLTDVVLRFDFRDEPMETIDVEYGFHREIGRLYGDGRLVKSGQPD